MNVVDCIHVGSLNRPLRNRTRNITRNIEGDSLSLQSMHNVINLSLTSCILERFWVIDTILS